MRTTVTIDETAMAKAAELTGITERSTLLRKGLEALIQRESARRLANLGGTDTTATASPRQRDAAT
jgi:Arc/MetJ family transcription regulator